MHSPKPSAFVEGFSVHIRSFLLFTVHLVKIYTLVVYNIYIILYVLVVFV